MPSQDPDTQARIVANMQAAERERLLNLVDPQRVLKPAEQQAAIKRAERAKLSSAGKLGQQTQARERAAYRQFVAERDAMIAELEQFTAAWTERLRSIGVSA